MWQAFFTWCCFYFSRKFLCICILYKSNWFTHGIKVLLPTCPNRVTFLYTFRYENTDVILAFQYYVDASFIFLFLKRRHSITHSYFCLKPSLMAGNISSWKQTTLQSDSFLFVLKGKHSRKLDVRELAMRVICQKCLPLRTKTHFSLK